MSMKLISTTTLGSNAANIEFTSIPGTYTDICFLISARSTAADIALEILIAFNGSTSNFSVRNLAGYGTAVQTTASANQVGGMPGSTATASTFNNGSLYIPNYAGSANKSYSVDSASENNGTNAYVNIVAGFWSNTAAITSVRFTSGGGGDLVSGSTISLYGITKGTDGVTTAS